MHVLKKEKEQKKWEEGSGGVRFLVGGWGLWRDMGKQYMVENGRGIPRSDADIQLEIVSTL